MKPIEMNDTELIQSLIDSVEKGIKLTNSKEIYEEHTWTETLKKELKYRLNKK